MITIQMPAIPKEVITAISGTRTTIVVFRGANARLYDLYRDAVEDCKALNEAVITDLHSGNETVEKISDLLGIVKCFHKEGLLSNEDVDVFKGWAHDCLTILQSIRF